MVPWATEAKPSDGRMMFRPSANVKISLGNTVAAAASFDVPPGTPHEALEVHDLAFSGGVEIRLVGC
jgi:hypothetical protein